jgi:uncharacterized Zn finger protein
MDYYYDYYGFKPYVPVSARRARAARELAKLEKQGRQTSPVVIEGRTIARTFWGEAWCDNLERYSDFANRLPRGRTYVRNGSVVDLQIAPGSVTALVSGSAMYDVKVSIAPVSRGRWRSICQECSGAIDSLVELLQGRFSKGVMTRLCEQQTGLFPSPRDIVFTCSCPDWASMCKHVAAVLYGIGARLDHQPELLFTLRKVNQQELIAKAGSDLSKTRKGPAGAKVLASDDLAGMFGIEMASASPRKRAQAGRTASRTTTKPPAGQSTPKRSNGASSSPSAKPAKLATPTTRNMSASEQRSGTRSWTPSARRAVAARMKKYWAERRALTKKPRTSNSS